MHSNEDDIFRVQPSTEEHVLHPRWDVNRDDEYGEVTPYGPPIEEKSLLVNGIIGGVEQVKANQSEDQANRSETDENSEMLFALTSTMLAAASKRTFGESIGIGTATLDHMRANPTVFDRHQAEGRALYETAIEVERQEKAEHQKQYEQQADVGRTIDSVSVSILRLQERLLNPKLLANTPPAEVNRILSEMYEMLAESKASLNRASANVIARQEHVSGVPIDIHHTLNTRIPT